MTKVGWRDFIVWQCSLRQRNFRMFQGKPSEGIICKIYDKKNNKDISGPPLSPKASFNDDKSNDISFILEEGFLMAGVKKPKHIKALQRALISLGYNLGGGGENKDGVDGCLLYTSDAADE